jgi:hypothetical protein
MIQVQGVGCKDGDRISFSYRNVNWDNQEDTDLFLYGHGNALCAPPEVPIYVITKFNLLK